MGSHEPPLARTIRVSNNGSEPRRYVFDVNQRDRGWLWVSPKSATLAPGQAAEVSIRAARSQFRKAGLIRIRCGENCEELEVEVPGNFEELATSSAAADEDNWLGLGLCVLALLLITGAIGAVYYLKQPRPPAEAGVPGPPPPPKPVPAEKHDAAIHRAPDGAEDQTEDETPAKSPVEDSISVQGIITDSGRKTAIINDEVRVVGDSVLGAIITAIGDSEVRFSHSGKEFTKKVGH